MNQEARTDDPSGGGARPTVVHVNKARLKPAGMGSPNRDLFAVEALLAGNGGFVYQATIDPVFVHLYITETAVAIVGRPLAWMFDQVVPAPHVLCVEEDLAALKGLDDARDRQTSYVVTYRIRQEDGSIRWLKESGRFHASSVGIMLTAVVHDVTMDRSLEEALASKDRLLLATAQAMAELIGASEIIDSLRKCVEVVGRSTGVDRVYLFTNEMDGDGAPVRTSQRVEWNSGTAAAQYDNPDLQDVPVEAFGEFMAPLQRDEPFKAVVAEIRSDEVRSFLEAQDILSILVLPITVQGRFWGFLGFDQCSHVRTWSAEEQAILVSLCSAMSSAVERDILVQHRTMDLNIEQAINRFNKAIIPLQTAADVYWSAVEEVVPLIKVDDCVVYAYHEAGDELVQVAALGAKTTGRREVTDALVLRKGQGIVGRAASRRRTELVNDTSTDPDYLADDSVRGAELAVPIIANGTLFGVIDLEHPAKGHFVPHHRRFVEMLADLIAMKLVQLNFMHAALDHERRGNELQARLNAELISSLEEREQRMRELAAIGRFPEVSPLPVLRVDIKGGLVYANPASAPLVKEWGLHIGGALPAELHARISEAATTGRSFRQAAGEHVFKVMVSEVEGFDFVNVYATDETSLEQLERLQEELMRQERMTVLGRLTAGVAHELNTPLGAISGSVSNMVHAGDTWFREHLPHLQVSDLPMLEPLWRNVRTTQLAGMHKRDRALSALLKEAYPALQPAHYWSGVLADLGWDVPLQSAQQAVLEHPHAPVLLRTLHMMYAMQSSARIIRHAAERSNRMVQALRSYIHRDATGIPLEFDLSRQMSDIIELFRSGTRRAIYLRLAKEDPILVKGIEDELAQVWTNLLTNAVQAISSKGNIWVEIATDEGSVKVTVGNDGPAIPDDVIGRVFEPMFTTKQRGEGTGLGLSIAQTIVHRHGGTIACRSVDDSTEFTVALPARGEAECAAVTSGRSQHRH